jgi:hypothetical protein
MPFALARSVRNTAHVHAVLQRLLPLAAFQRIGVNV